LVLGFELRALHLLGRQSLHHLSLSLAPDLCLMMNSILVQKAIITAELKQFLIYSGVMVVTDFSRLSPT
jgi:hypothetical protein